MKKIYLIGIGPGNPDYLTIQAIDTMKKVDVFFILEKEGEKEDELALARMEILKRYLDEKSYRVVVAEIPKRKKSGRYEEGVKKWRVQKAEIITKLINNMADGQIGAFLVWGDPSLYDGHLEILQDILKQGIVDFEYEVIPGITSVQILTAKHKIPLNRIGENIVITTGRRLKEYQANEINNTAVLLDSYATFNRFKDEELDIYWGGYLGNKEEILVSGRLNEVIEKIKTIRKAAKRRRGWMMDTYILRKAK
ncbi:MAG: precorrin-6A synthase (deacetylating) [bacterium]